MSSQGCLTVPNGKVCYNGTTAGSIAEYTCDGDSDVNVTRKCGSDGRWEGAIPVCRKKMLNQDRVCIMILIEIY